MVIKHTTCSETGMSSGISGETCSLVNPLMSIIARQSATQIKGFGALFVIWYRLKEPLDFILRVNGKL